MVGPGSQRLCLERRVSSLAVHHPRSFANISAANISARAHVFAQAHTAGRVHTAGHNSSAADPIIAQGRVLVHAIAALSVIEPAGPFERTSARLLPHIYERRLRGIVEAAPSWATEETLSATERTDGEGNKPGSMGFAVYFSQQFPLWWGS